MSKSYSFLTRFLVLKWTGKRLRMALDSSEIFRRTSKSSTIRGIREAVDRFCRLETEHGTVLGRLRNAQTRLEELRSRSDALVRALQQATRFLDEELPTWWHYQDRAGPVTSSVTCLESASKRVAAAQNQLERLNELQIQLDSAVRQ